MSLIKNGPVQGPSSNPSINYSIKSQYITKFVNCAFVLVRCTGKMPIEKGWVNAQYDPFLTPEDFPDNYGIVLQDDDLVVDADPRNYKGGVNSLDKLAKTVGYNFQDTFVVRTGGDGFHVYLKKNPKVKVQEKHEDYPGLEFKSKGRQVIGPGSLHPDTKKYYIVHQNEIRSIKKVEDVAPKLIELIKKDNVVGAKLNGIDGDFIEDDFAINRFTGYLNRAPIAITGERGDDCTYKVACKGKDWGLSPGKTYDLMLEHYNDRCIPPWSDSELLKKVTSAYRNGKNAVGCDTAEADFKHVKIVDNNNSEHWLNRVIIKPSLYKLGVEEKNFTKLNDTFRANNEILAFKGLYIQIWSTQKDDQNYLNFKILSNYVIQAKRNLIEVSEGLETHNLEIVVNDIKGKESKPIMLAPDSKVNPKKAAEIIAAKGNFVDILTEKQYKAILFDIYKAKDLCNKFIYQTPGLIKSRNIWLYSDSIVDLKTGEVIKAKDDVIKLDDKTEITLGTVLSDRPYLNYKDGIDLEELANSLIDSLCKGYNNSIEPFLVLGTAIMAPFADFFLSKINGFPIVWSQGLSGGGKSNLFDTIACLYGFNKGFSQSGSSTINKMWQTLSQYNSIPVMFEETSGKISGYDRFENDVKCWYDRKKRGRMFNGQKEDNQNVNAIPMFSSNNLPPQKDAVLNRLVFCTFRPDNFVVEEAKKFNTIRDTELSSLLPEILKRKESEISNLFNEAEKILCRYNHNLDNRSENNIKVALAGILLLFDIAQVGIDDCPLEKLEQYILKHNEMYESENAFDVFLSYLPNLRADYRLKVGDHFEIDINSNRLKIDHKAIYPIFAKEFKLVTGLLPPTLKEILSCASQDKKVIAGKDTVTKNLRLAGKQKKVLEIDITDNDSLKSLYNIAIPD